MDPRTEGYSFQSPFVYAANNPIFFIDYNGEYPRWLKGALIATGGALQVAGGVGACMIPGGQPVGILLISTGVTTTGLGIAQTVQPEAGHSSGFFEAVGQGIEQNTNTPANLREIGSFMDIGIGLLVPDPTDISTTIGSIAITAIPLLIENNSTNSSSSTSTQSAVELGEELNNNQTSDSNTNNNSATESMANSMENTQIIFNSDHRNSSSKTDTPFFIKHPWPWEEE